MIRIELPCPYDFRTLAEYMKAIRPVREQWSFLHRDSQWKSPADEWRWCWQQDEVVACL